MREMTRSVSGNKVGFLQSMESRLLLQGLLSVLLPIVAMIAIAIYQSDRIEAVAAEQVQTMVDREMDALALDTYRLVRAADEAYRGQLAGDLNVARDVLQTTGTATLGEEEVSWQAVNQFTKESVTVSLPKMLAGGTWLGQNSDMEVGTPVVDEVMELTGVTCTVFQRMNPAGDMLRVATNVQAADGTRAIGTYIPAIMADGSPNGVLAEVLAGGTYRGRAFVVNDWYLTAYEPITDDAGDIMGMLYVGLLQDSAGAVRQAILETKVGETGYMYVLGGSGDQRGHYIISKDGLRDGDDIWEAKDADGNLFIQSIVNSAVALEPGEMATERYPWLNQGESEPRMKVARLVYYAPWDWVIGAGTYEDDYSAFYAQLGKGTSDMLRFFAFGGLLMAVVGVAVAWWYARRLSKPVKIMTAAAQDFALGGLAEDINVEERKSIIARKDEMGALAQAFLQMETANRGMEEVASRIADYDLTVEVRPRSERDGLGQALSKMVANLSQAIAQVREGADAVGSSSGELSRTADVAGEATQQVAMTIEEVARGSAHTAEALGEAHRGVDELTRAIDGVAQGAQESAGAVGVMSSAAGMVSDAAGGIEQRARAAGEQAQSSRQVAREGLQATEATLANMREIARVVQEAGRKVSEMGERSQEIGKIVATIEDIAGQTNLLALNAQIEAARAGEQGRGFAVVADEVRKLAERSARATQEIAALIAAVQSGSGEAVASMAAGGEQVDKGVSVAEQAGEVIRKLEAAVEAIAGQIGAIGETGERLAKASDSMMQEVERVSAVVEESSASTEEMAASSSQVSESLTSVASISEEASAGAEEVAAAAQELSLQVRQVTAVAQSLAGEAEGMRRLAARFRLTDDRPPEGAPTGRAAAPRESVLEPVVAGGNGLH